MPARYRFLLRPKWIAFHLLVIFGIIMMINFGFWQLRRLDQRREFNATIEARYDAPVEPLDDLLAEADTLPEGLDDVDWRPASAAGTYDVDANIRIVNRSQEGAAGDNIVTPMTLDDGRILLVNRGFLPISIEEIPPAPTGRVELTGRVRVSQVRRLGQLSDPAEGELELAQRVDIERLSQQLDGEVVPVYVDLIDSQPSSRTNGLPAPVIKPDLSEGNHLSYAFQWFIFSITVAVGWVLAVRRSIRTNDRKLAGGGTSPADDDVGDPTPESDDPRHVIGRRYR